MDNFGAKVSAATPSCLTAANALTATWEITETVAMGSNVALTFQYNSTTTKGASFLNNTARLFHCNGATPDSYGAAGASGTTILTISASGFTSFSPFGVSSDAILPIELTSISVKADNRQNHIAWQTATEQNTQQFNIERSNNELSNWQTIGSVKAAGNSQTTKDYQFTDATPLSISYYRLRTVDFDGKEQVSNVVSAQQNGDGKLKVYPTLSGDKVTIRTENNDLQDFTVVDLLGRMVLRGQIEGQKELTISHLSIGTYLLKVGAETVKFSKQ